MSGKCCGIFGCLQIKECFNFSNRALTKFASTDTHKWVSKSSLSFSCSFYKKVRQVVPTLYTNHLKECVCAYYSLYWSSKLAWRRASSSGSSCSPLTQEGTHWLLKLHVWTTQTHMKTVTLTCALTKLLQGLSRVNNSCRQLTGIKLCLSMPVTQSSRLSYLHSVCAVSHCSLSYYISFSHTPPHTQPTDWLGSSIFSQTHTHTYTARFP